MGDNWKDDLGYIKKLLERRKEKATGSRPGTLKNLRVGVRTSKQPVADSRTSRSPAVSGHKVSAPQERVTSLPQPPEAVAPKASPVNIGLDFGTSTSKVCVRRALGLAANVPVYPVSVGDTSYGPSRFLCPSTVAVQEGKFYFGWEAEKKAEQGAVILRHLKVCLACETERSTQRPVRGCQASHEAEAQGCAGRFRVDDQEVSARDLVIAYLGWIIGEAMKRLPIGLSSQPDLRFTCNLGIPIDWIESSSPLTSVYERLGFSAWQLSRGMEQGIPLDAVRHWILLTDRKPLPPANKSPVQLCPETTAAVISYANSSNPALGLYGLVDVGAWTTDISFFRLTDISLTTQGVRTLAFYSAKTYRVAADQIDERLCDFLTDIWGVYEVLPHRDGSHDLTSLIRHDREVGTLETANLHWKGEERRVPCATVEVARMLTASAAQRNFVNTHREAYKKEIPPEEPKWRDFPILLMGRGSHEKCFEDTLRRNVKLCGAVKLLPLTPLEFHDQTESCESSISHRLAVAHGLSFPRALWPHFIEPASVAPPSPERVKTTEPISDNQPG